jgi:hypothetical protein
MDLDRLSVPSPAETCAATIAEQFLTATNKVHTVDGKELSVDARLAVYRLREDRAIADFAAAAHDMKQQLTVNSPINPTHRARASHFAEGSLSMLLLRLGTRYGEDLICLITVNLYFPLMDTIILNDRCAYRAGDLAILAEGAGDLAILSEGFNKSSFKCRFYLPQRQTRPRVPVGDEILQFMCVVVKMTEHNKISLHGMDRTIELGDFFTSQAWPSCFKETQNIVFEDVRLARWQWEAIKNVPFRQFTFGGRNVPSSFLRETPASTILIRMIDSSHTKAIASRSEDNPIPSLTVYCDSEDTKSVDILGALSRIQTYGYHNHGSPAQLHTLRHSWHLRSFWHGLRDNSCLKELSLPWGVMYYFNELQVVKYIVECLEVNPIIEIIHYPGLISPESDVYWKENLLPLLELNKRHQPRVNHKETRPAVLLDALQRIQRHPTKTYLFLKQFHHVLFPKSESTKRKCTELLADGDNGALKRVCTVRKTAPQLD